MFFYKLQGISAEAACNDDRQAKKELTRRIAIATADYNSLNSDEWIRYNIFRKFKKVGAKV